MAFSKGDPPPIVYEALHVQRGRADAARLEEIMARFVAEAARMR